MIRALSLIFIVAAAGLLWLQVQHNEREYTSLQSLYKWCFDDSQSNETRIKACAVNYEAGHNKSHEALDQLLSLYAQNDNFNEGAQRVNAAIEGGLDAPRWLFWQAYFNEKRKIDQPPITALIKQVKGNPDFIYDLRDVLSKTADKRYALSVLAQLEGQYDNPLWLLKVKGWVYYNLDQDQAAVETYYAAVLQDLNDPSLFNEYGSTCYKSPEYCLPLDLIEPEEMVVLSCDKALEIVLEGEENLDCVMSPINGRTMTLLERYQSPDTRWLQAGGRYAQILGLYFNNGENTPENTIRLVALKTVLDCSNDIAQDPELKAIQVKESAEVKRRIYPLYHHNLEQYLQHQLKGDDLWQ